MTTQGHFVQPPAIAVWLVNLFALPEEAESILGDLLEEFAHLASKSGVPLARRWYWRQTVKTLAHLALVGYRTAPWATTAAVVGGFLLRRLVGRMVEPAIFAVLQRYHVYENHFSTYLFFASTGIDIGHVLSFVFIGWMVALAARGREMVATMTLGLVFFAMAVVAGLVSVSKSGDGAYLWRLTWYFTDSFAIVLAGGIVRTYRAAATIRPTVA